MKDLARLRIAVFRDYPYLYDGSPEYEEEYLSTYLQSANSIAILALDNGRVVGASTGLPLIEETAEFQAPFLDHGYDLNTVFYCGESVLLKEHRGGGVYRQFFAGRENHARQLGGFDLCTFCCVQRPADHPRRPADYEPLDAIWRHFGYEEQAQLQTRFAWKEIDEAEESSKPMLFWTRRLEHEA